MGSPLKEQGAVASFPCAAYLISLPRPEDRCKDKVAPIALFARNPLCSSNQFWGGLGSQVALEGGVERRVRPLQFGQENPACGRPGHLDHGSGLALRLGC